MSFCCSDRIASSLSFTEEEKGFSFIFLREITLNVDYHTELDVIRKAIVYSETVWQSNV